MSAALAYKNAGGDARPVAKLIGHFDETPLRPADLPRDVSLAQHWQQKINEAAIELFPDHSPATRNREVYTPMSAILKSAGLDFHIKRPDGARGRELVGWLWPEQAERLLIEAANIHPEFGLLCQFFLYTGCRLSEGTLWFTIDNLRLSESFAFIPKTKNGNPRAVHLPPPLVVGLANHPRGLDRPGERVFRWRPSGRLYDKLYLAAERAEIVLPDREAFHIFRHSYGTWMRRYGGADTKALVDSGAWDSEQSASRYAHAVASEDAKRADSFPVLKIATK